MGKVIDKNKKPNVKLFVVSHKKLLSELYKDRTIIYVGKNGEKFKEENDYVDSTLDNISSLNYSYCELTAMYWIYKNVDCDIVGLEHYRRLYKSIFLRIRSKKYFIKKLKKYDIILPQRYPTPKKVKTLMMKYHGKESYPLLEEAISKMCPDYLDSFHKCMNKRYANYFNVLVTRKEIFDQYAEFLFKVLDYVFEKAKDIKEININRYIGFLAERLINTFIYKNKYKTIERLVIFDFKYKNKKLKAYSNS